MATVVASGDNCGDDCHWAYDDESKTLSFTGTGAMYDYTTAQDVHDNEGQEWAYNRPWINYINEVRNVEIGEGITTTGKYLCAGCIELENLLLPSSLKYVSLDSFMHTNLQNVVIPESVESINHEAFLNSRNIQNIYCPYKKKDACQNALELSYSEGMLTIYEKNNEGLYIVGNKIYANLHDIVNDKYIPKRIYTIEEAEKVSKKTGNTFKLRYK